MGHHWSPFHVQTHCIVLVRCFIIVGWAWTNSTLLVSYTDHAYSISSRVCQPGQLHMQGLSFKLKPWAVSMPCRSIVHVRPFSRPQAPCLISACLQPAFMIHGLLVLIRTRCKLPCMLQFGLWLSSLLISFSPTLALTKLAHAHACQGLLRLTQNIRRGTQTMQSMLLYAVTWASWGNS